jgi:AraC-like DNA-binding protein
MKHSGLVRTKGFRRSRDEDTVRVSATAAIPDVLRRLGANADRVLRQAGIDPRLFDHADNRISFAARGHVVRHCAEATGCEHFGLLVGQQNDLRILGLMGLLVKYSPDVGAALHSLVRYFHLHVQGAALGLVVDGDRAVLSYDIVHPDVEGTEHLGDGAIAMLFNSMRTLCGADWRPVEARLARRKPEDARPYRRFFGVPVRFDAEQYALVFGADCLTLSLPETDPELRRLLQQQIDVLAAARGDTFLEQVRSVLHTALLTHRAKAEQVASLFSMHRRTMCRRLAAFDTSFQELVDEARFEMAQQLLQDSTMYVVQIAAVLDYADARAFTRAFKRWSGMTPLSWRASHVSRN